MLDVEAAIEIGPNKFYPTLFPEHGGGRFNSRVHRTALQSDNLRVTIPWSYSVGMSLDS